MSDPWTDAGIKPLDGYLSTDERALVSRMFENDRDASAAALAYDRAGQTQNAFDRWGVVFRRKFPAYG
jgi:hypothetical protein